MFSAHSRVAGMVAKALCLEAVLAGHGSVKAILSYVRGRGLQLSQRSVYYHLQSLVRSGVLKHSYAVYSVADGAADYYRGLLRALFPYAVKIANRARGGPRGVVVRCRYFVEGNEAAVRVPVGGVARVLGGVGFRGAVGEGVSRVMVYERGGWVHSDVAVSGEGAGRFLEGDFGVRFSSVVWAAVVLLAEIRSVWGERVFERVVEAARCLFFDFVPGFVFLGGGV